MPKKEKSTTDIDRYVWKSLTSFCGPEMAKSTALTWTNVLSQGQDLECFRCKQSRNADARSGKLSWMVCDACRKQKLATAFEPEMHVKWVDALDEEILCKFCKYKGRQPDSCDRFYCNCKACKEQRRSNHFLESDLVVVASESLSELALMRARCKLSADEDMKQTVLTCSDCNIEKQIIGFGAIVCKQFLRGERRMHVWRCYSCQYPQ